MGENGAQFHLPRLPCAEVEVKPQELRREKLEWNKTKPGLPNDKEILAASLLIVKTRESVAALEKWVADVRSNRARFQSEGAAGLPVDWKPVRSKVPAIYEQLERVFTSQSSWNESMLEAVCGAMARWDGAEQQLGLEPQDLRNWKQRMPAARTKGPPRWKVPEMLFGVAEMIHRSRLVMQKLLEISEAPSKPTLMESMAMQKAMKVDLRDAELEVHRKRDAHRQTAKRLTAEKAARKKERTSAKGAAKAAATAAKKKLKEVTDAYKAAAKKARAKRIAEVRAQLKPAADKAALGQKQAQISRANTLRNKANKRARDAEGQLEKERKVSKSRLQRLESAVSDLQSANHDLDRYGEHYQAALNAKQRYGAIADNFESMPTWRPVVGKGSGRGRPKMEWGMRVIIYMMLAQMCPASAIGAIIVAIVKRAAPWLNPVGPTHASVREMRFELRILEEALAARRVAAAHRVRQLGFDETTKFQEPSMVTSVLLEPTEGAAPEVVILRAAYATGGATSELLVRAIEDKCFARLRGFLEGWEAECKSMYPDYEWTGPKAERSGLQRLGGRGSIISDTCSTALCTQRLLIAEVARQIEKAHPN